MNIENSYEILSSKRGRHSRQQRLFRLFSPPPPVSTKHKVIEEKTFHEHNGKNISMIGFGHYYSTS